MSETPLPRPGSQAAAVAHFPVALGLGSNIGPARAIFDSVCAALENRGVRVVLHSRLYLTRPWGETCQANFTNAALLIETFETPQKLLELCLDIELSLGRHRMKRWGPREIDIDILYFGAERIRDPGLTIPHPLLARRDFVLAPLRDLGVQPPAGSKLPDWEMALSQLEPAQRTIISTEPW